MHNISMTAGSKDRSTNAWIQEDIHNGDHVFYGTLTRNQMTQRQEIDKPSYTQSESVSGDDIDPEQAQRDKDNAKEFGTHCKGSQRLVKDYSYHKELMIDVQTAEQEQEECKTTLDETNRALGEATSCRDSCLIALPNKQNEFEKYKAFNDRTIDYDILQTKLNETLGLLALKDIEIKEGLKTKAYEILVLNQKHDELVKKSLLTKSQLEGRLKEKTKVILDLKVKEEKVLSKMIAMDKQTKVFVEMVYTRNQTISHSYVSTQMLTYNGRPILRQSKVLLKKAQSKKPCIVMRSHLIILIMQTDLPLLGYLNDVNARTKKPKINLSNVSSSSNSLADCITSSPISLLTWMQPMHMTGNLKLLCNFVEKFLGTVHFGNDQFALILGYGDLNHRISRSTRSGIAFRDSFIVSKKRSSDSSKKLNGIQTLTPAKQEVADIMKALKESKKMNKRQPGTEGSNEGTGVPDGEKLILEWEADVDSEHFDKDDNADPAEIYKSVQFLKWSSHGSYPVAIVASRAVDPVGSPSSTTIDQDEQSTSTSPTNQEIQSQVTHQGPVPQFMAPDHSSSGPVLHEMTSDQIRSDLTPNRQETSVDNISSDLVSNKQKASDYDISGPVPPRKNVVSLADKTDSSQKEIEFLFNHFFEEYFSPINVHAEENNNDQAANASF
ncbi:hypothetical protein Tco_1045756 [Tanacetum coccineum]|uniref:Integrase, catalytic region, zinc finger, CCHC-type, peptidase aspartic, catalytic n=1 Tax=Tanacetum coccineum TaxID=301880 RepID=A0ABQ5GUU3_9ASTR